jgi:4-hydroxy-tetrahydrodipicolinate synthase
VLAKHPNIRATKEANGDLSALVRTMALCGDDLDIYSGEDSQAFAITAMGGRGVISVFANICPRESHELIQKAVDGDFKGSFALQKKYIALMDALFSDVNPIPVKAAMNMLGWNCGPCRLPLDEMTPAGKAALETCLRDYGLLK